MPTSSLTSLSSLDARALARRLGELAGDERKLQVEFLLHLDEFDRRRAWAELGHGSLWTFCLTVLHLWEGSAEPGKNHPSEKSHVPHKAGAICVCRLPLDPR